MLTRQVSSHDAYGDVIHCHRNLASPPNRVIEAITHVTLNNIKNVLLEYLTLEMILDTPNWYSGLELK